MQLFIGLKEMTILSTVDLKQGYYQISMENLAF